LIFPRAWRRGYALEACRRIVAHLLDDEGATRVEVTTAIENRAARALAERLGFRPDGERGGAAGYGRARDLHAAGGARVLRGAGAARAAGEGASDMPGPILLDGDELTFTAITIPPIAALLAPGKATIQGSGVPTVKGKKICVKGDEKKSAVKADIQYTAAGFPL